MDLVSRYQRVSRQFKTPEDTEQIHAALDELAGVLGNTPWVLGGGVAIALGLGSFYRGHSDLDVVVEQSNLEQLLAAIRPCGYRLYTRKTMKHKPFGCVLQVPLPTRGPLLWMRPGRLCLMRRDETGNRYLDRLDLYVYREAGDKLIPLDGATPLDLRYPIIGATFTTRSGYSIHCLHPGYIRQFTLTRGGANMQSI